MASAESPSQLAQILPGPAGLSPLPRCWEGGQIWGMTTIDRIRKLEDELATLRTEQADLLRRQARFEVDVWQGRIDDLEIQVHLGAMEAGDRLQPLMDKLKVTWDDSRGQLAAAGATATSVAETLRDGLESAIADIRTALLESKQKVSH